MRLVNIEREREQLAFAEKAAAAFAGDPKMYSYTSGAIEDGCLLALRWGLHQRAVVVLKLDDEHAPTIYGDLVPRSAAPEPAAETWVVVCQNEQPHPQFGIDERGPIVWETYTRGATREAAKKRADEMQPAYGTCRIARLVFEEPT